MGKIFGFDLGTNSIGWAVVDENSHTIDGMGSVIFPMGVKLEKGSKEVSTNETRRIKRQIRRQYFRRGIRKAKLTEKLMEKGLFPDVNELYNKYFPDQPEKSFSPKFQRLIQQVPLSNELSSFFKINPYEQRARAYNNEQLTKLQLGRVFYQMGLRRGYRETLKDGDEKGAIYSGDAKEGKTGINETLEKIQAYGTLGNYLYHENPHITRLRNRYTLRSMYTSEFDLIYENQRKYYPEVLDDEFFVELGYRHKSDPLKNGILFYQRPLRSQKHLLGNCRYETDKSVAPKSTLEFERFRALTIATNIKVNNDTLSETDQKLVTDFLLKLDKAKDFIHLRRKLTNPDGNYNYSDKEKLPASPTHANLKKIFKKEYSGFSQKQLEDLWHLKYWAEDPEWLKEYLKENYQLAPDQIDQFIRFRMADGYSNLSRKAIRSISEFMELGYGNDEAVLLAGVKRAVGDKWESLAPDERATIEDTTIAIAKDGTAGPSIDRIKTFLREHLNLNDRALRKLYHHSFKSIQQLEKYLPEPSNVRNPIVQRTLNKLRTLYNSLVDEYGQPEKITVELARELKGSKKERDKIRSSNLERRGINIELKKVLDQYQQPHTVENIRKLQLFNEIRTQNGRVPNPYNPEQTFGIEDLFNRGVVQIEHIIPRSRSLNNSLSNMTLCDADINRAKRNMTPAEYYKSIGADWEAIRRSIFRILPYQKAKRFILEKNTDAEDFISRQLNDTRYISRYAVDYLKKVCRNVDIIQGTVSALLRHYWGLDGILTPAIPLDIENGEYLAAVAEDKTITSYKSWNPKTLDADRKGLAKSGVVYEGNVIHGKFYPRKDRLDHRHHAIDALVVALAKRKHLQQLSTAHARDESLSELKKSEKHIVERPWESFWTDTRRAVDNILIYHDQNNRVLTKIKKKLYDYKGNPRTKNGKQLYGEGYSARGPLHEESVYGRYQFNGIGPQYHIRKSVNFIENHKHLAKVVDEGVRAAIRKRLIEVGIEVDNLTGWKISDAKAEFKNKIFFITGEDNIPQPQIFLPNRNGEPIPVRKVRTRENVGNAAALKDEVNQYVNPKNNHHVQIYFDPEENLNERVVNFWEAVERARTKQPVYQSPSGCRPWFSMETNDLFLLGLPEHHLINWEDLDHQFLSNFLYRVQKVSSKYYEFRIHRATTINFESEMIRIQSLGALQATNPIKVKMNIIGKLGPW